jgi:diguanylate cyclase (GGDEF)-like protein/PAS domain S-box-containing protein
MKRLERTRHIPVIFLTAVSKDTQQVFRGYSAGAVDYLVKPLEPAVLRSKVAVFVELHYRKKALEASEDRFRTAFDNAPIGIALAGIDGRWLQVNRSLCEMTGYSEQDLLERGFEELSHPDDVEPSLADIGELLEAGASRHQVEKRYVRADGEVVWVLLSVSRVLDPEGKPLHFIVQAEDVTERKLAQQELALRALHDPLTGLPNRTLFLDRLEQALARLERGAASLAVMFVDLDGFKVVNDSLGHERGDQLLVEVSGRLREALRPADTIARLGGDEFIVLCEEVGEEDQAVTLAERIQQALSTPFALGGREIFVTASIGIVLAADSGAYPVDIIRDADAAMYRAKARGRSRCELFDDDTRHRAIKRLATENALHRALEKGQLDVFYQSTVDVATGAVVGTEALARWTHPKLGTVPPEEFIPLAEEIGLILPLGTWVLEEACRQWAQWRDERPDAPPAMAVNLSARQLAQPDLCGVVRAAVEAAGMDPSALCLEITESVLIEDRASIAKALHDLKHLGVTLAIDDFGTGYSALGYLRRLPIDILKIDSSFVSGLGDDPNGASILAAVIDLAHAVDMRTVAEGVETAEQLAELRRLCCDWAQGFYFDTPRPPESV